MKRMLNHLFIVQAVQIGATLLYLKWQLKHEGEVKSSNYEKINSRFEYSKDFMISALCVHQTKIKSFKN